MKKKIFIKVFVAILIALFFPSCSEVKSIIKSYECLNFLGKTKFVEANVSSVYFNSNKKSPIKLNLDGKYPNQQLTIIIFKDKFYKNFNNDFLVNLENKKILVWGKIEQYKGQLQIVIEDQNQIAVFPEKRTSKSNILLSLNDPERFKTPKQSSNSQIGTSLIRAIKKSKRTIDFALYGLRGQKEILEELKEASLRGVYIRGVVDMDVENKNYYTNTMELLDIVDEYNTDFYYDLGKYGDDGKENLIEDRENYKLSNGSIMKNKNSAHIASRGDIMHNKFFIIDDNIVWTGSANTSDTGTGGYNANISILVENAYYASLFKMEFEEMFINDNFHEEKFSNKKCSALKIRNNTTLITQFSPQSKPVQNLILPLIRSAEKKINIAVFYLTHFEIAKEIIQARKRGVDVRIIIDATSAQNAFSKHIFLRNEGIPLKIENWGGKMHMKTISVDGNCFIAGSMNWTKAGNLKNDENTTLVFNKELTRDFDLYYDRIWNSIDDKWLDGHPDPESKDSKGSLNDQIDNDFDRLVDREDDQRFDYHDMLEKYEIIYCN